MHTGSCTVSPMFTVSEREQLREALLEKARADPRIVAAAAVGGSAGEGDRWSDLDLGFGVAGDATVDAVLADWTIDMVDGRGAAHLFDLPFLTTIYRVFLLPGALQVDLSFTPVAEFGALGPRFELVFGEPAERTPPLPPAAAHTFGLAVHHAVRGHICIERGRLWQAEYWIHALRVEAMALACGRLGLERSHGRGFDRLPADLLRSLQDALIQELTVSELRRASTAAIAALLHEGEHIAGLAPWLRAELEALSHSSA